MHNKIKKAIPLKWKLYGKYVISPSKRKEYERYVDRKKIIICLAADYGNLGDVAITYAQREYLKVNYPEYEIIDLAISKTFSNIKALKNICTKEDIITIVGGGNMGDLYEEIEMCRRFVIKVFCENKIISFPQTIDFSNTKKGNKSLKKTINRYSSHNNLTIVARERISYERMKKYFNKNKVVLSPDIVMSLNESNTKINRDGITFCLRDDKEKLIDSKIQNYIITKIENNIKNIRFYDTHIGNGTFTVTELESELNKIWQIFKESKLVVTDRLHGMIFCYITNTPCLVIPNNNHKIVGCYHWIKHDNNKLINIENIDDVIHEVIEIYNKIESNKFTEKNSKFIEMSNKFKVLDF